MKWTDEEIDKLFQDSSAKESFSYKPEYWEEFNASLSAGTPLSKTSDEEFDAAFRESASAITVNYKPEFWQEFSNSLPVIIPTENIADAEVDALYREEATQLSFEYKPTYWEEMATMLRQRRRRPDFLWFGLSGVFVVAITAMMFIDQTPLGVDVNPIETIAQMSSPQNDIATNLNTGSDAALTASNNPVANNSDSGDANNAVDQNGTEAPIVGVPVNVAQNGNTGLNPGTEPYTPQVVEPDVTNDPSITQIDTKRETVLPTESLKPLATEAVADNNERSLHESYSEIPKLPKYRGGLNSGLYIQGLGGISQSSITPSDAISTSYGVGAGWMMHKRNWTFNIGSNFLIENFSDLRLTRSAKVYGFGADLYQFDLHYKRLFTAELELFAGYNIGRHQIRFGIRPSFAFSSLVDVSEMSLTSSQGEMIESSEQRTSVYGFMEGINQWGVKPSLGYAYNFKSDWTLGVNIGTELMPSINEEFINGVNNTLPLDGQLYIRKTLNFKR